MNTEFLIHIVVPFAAVLVLVLFRAATRDHPIGWEDCNEMAVELAILGIGATGGIFANPQLIKKLGSNEAVYGMLVVLGDLFLAGIIVYRSRWRRSGPVRPTEGLLDLFLASLTVVAAGILSGVGG